MQFKKAFRVLNIALTAKEIDLLLNYCNFHVESLIDWKEFLRKMNIREEKKNIIDRLHPKIQYLSNLLHYFMVSPKDAYRKVFFHLSSGTTPELGICLLRNFTKCFKNFMSKHQSLYLNSNCSKSCLHTSMSERTINWTSRSLHRFLGTARPQVY